MPFNSIESHEHLQGSHERNLKFIELQDPLKSKLLLLCRKAKEQLADPTLESVSFTIPANLFRAAKYVPLKRDIDQDGSWIPHSAGCL